MAAAAPSDLSGRAVAVIGVPENDSKRNPQGMPEIFGDTFGTLRIQPGRILGIEPEDMTAKLLYDCSTIGGSGGAPVIDLTTGAVLGFHMGGMFLHQNYAVPAWELARDPRVRSHGLRFADEPAWMPRWIDSECGEPAAPMPRPEPRRGVRHFQHRDALALFDLLIDAGFATADRQPALFFGMDLEFLASLPTAGAPADRLRTTLDLLNRTPALLTGELPMETLLMNAVSHSRPLVQSTKLGEYPRAAAKGGALARHPEAGVTARRSE